MGKIEKCICVALLCFGVITVAIIVALGINDARFIKAGYTQEMMPGRRTAMWVKK